MYVRVCEHSCLYYISLKKKTKLKNISSKTGAWLLVYPYWSLQRDHPAQFQSCRPWPPKVTRVRLWMPRIDPVETSKPIWGRWTWWWFAGITGVRSTSESRISICLAYLIVVYEPPNQTVSCRYVKTTKRDEQPHACIHVKYSLNKLHQSLFYGKNSKLLVCVRLWVSELYCLISKNYS